MSKRKITITATVTGDPVRTALLYKRGDWAVTEPFGIDMQLGMYRVTHIPTTYGAKTPGLRVFTLATAKRIVNRFNLELPRRKTFKGIMKHGVIAATIIREEYGRKP